ncbi:assimilatory nitrate reductase catalytic subunit [Sinomonas atrocyanea]|uniref:molybdopterin oxidoreductase family protein n=1 Tax=Sinomonas atrocyanea TaxID=37927 RepID=UPI002787ED57|nr:molybdopterin oxidoreductase family protein [Sinomonas atrocyanea]MDQ0259828.1 assimilatory nitrate reductase catalytic subunit [Sinomonas atrocyanea]
MSRTAAAPAVPTHCPYCALQCAMSLSSPGPAATSAVPEVSGRDFPTNRGGLCRKGWTSAELLAHPGRLTAPLMRADDGELRPVSWEAALERVAAEVRRAQARHGKDAVGVFGGGGLTNEKAYLLGKFARIALGTSRIDYNGRFCMSSAAAAGTRAFGLDRGLPFPVADLAGADTVLLLGSNVAETMPPFVAHLAGARAAGGLIVVDPRRTATAALADDGAGLHLQPAPHTDLVLLLGLAHVVLAEGLAAHAYLADRAARGTPGEGPDALARSVAPWWPERVQAATGVPATLVRETARRLAQSARTGSCYILTGRGVEQHADGTDTATAAINLALLLGLPGSRRGGYGTLTGQGNGQGGREHGQKADQLPGYRKITDPAARQHVARVWGVPEASIPGPGLPAVELLASLGKPASEGPAGQTKAGGVRCLFVHGANPAVSAPDATAVLAGLRALDFLVVCDFFLSETAREADVVLPVLQWAEEEGTMTNLEGRVLRRRRATAPPPGPRSELWIMHRLGALLGAPSSFPEDPREVFEELRAASAGGPADYSGITYERLDAGEALHWPCPAGAPGAGRGQGKARLFLDRFAHPDGRARIVPVRPNTPAGAPAGPAHRPAPALFQLATGRLLEHYQSGAQTRRVASLAAAQPEVRLEIHPASAARLGIADGAWVAVRRADAAGSADARGAGPEVRCRAQVTAEVRPDTVFLPFHFPGPGAANRVTEQRTDPISGMPEFKTTRVLVVPLPQDRTGPVPSVSGALPALVPVPSKEAPR